MLCSYRVCKFYIIFSYWVATEEDFVEVSVTEAVEVAAEDAAVVAVDAEVAAARKTRNGSP